jgi:anti-sigma factor RsiW
MHQIIQDGLEDYLTDTLDAANRQAFDQHLKTCPECQSEVEAMKAISSLFATLRVDEKEAVAPQPGFYAKLTNHVEQREESSIWTLLFQPAFARQVAMASLLFLAVVGGFLISRESETTPMPTAEQVMASDHFGDEDQARGQMLVTLASYE